MIKTAERMDLQKVKQDDGSIRVTFDGKPLVCLVCGNDRYDERSSLLNTRGGEFLGFAWADEEATNFICTRCQYVFWFRF
jgi:hypothetical protein